MDVANKLNYSTTVIQAINTLWEFNQLNQELVETDVIIILGSQDLTVPIRGAEIFHQGLSKNIITSGGFGRLSGELKIPEAETFQKILIENHVPKKLYF